jgi:membrane protease YdiL (CAAX protease family)
MKAIWAGNTIYSKFLITVGIILLCGITFTLLSTVLATFIGGVNMTELQAILTDPSQPRSLWFLKLIQTFSAIGAFIIPPLILAYLFSNHPFKYLSLDKKPEAGALFLVLLIMLIATPVINFLGELNSHLHLPESLKGIENWMRNSEEKAAELTKLFLKMDTPSELFFNLFMIGLLPALGEELVFRGIVQKLFHQWSKNMHVAVWTSAILFSAIHMQFYGFLPRMILGAMLGYMLVWSGNLWLPIAGHFINNAGAVIFVYLFQNGYSTLDPDKIGTSNDFTSVALSLVITSGLYYLLFRKSLTDNINQQSTTINQKY